MRTLEARYAQALFEDLRNEVRFQADSVLLTGSPELWRSLNNPCIPVSEKHALLERVLPETDPLLLNFYRLLCDNGRMGLLEQILREYHRLTLEAEGAADVLLRCAFPPSQEDRDRVCQALCKRYGLKRVELQLKQEPELLGGFILQMGDITYDRSVRGRLRGLRDSLKAR